MGKKGEADPAAGRVLVVDDDHDLRDILALVLSKEGFQVAVAADGAAALAALREQRCGVALVDFMLPDMSGLELIRNAKGLDPDLQFVAVTGQGSERVAVEIMKAGAADYLVKPFETADIVKAVRHGFEERVIRTSSSYRSLVRDLADKNALLEAQMGELSRRMSETNTLAEAGRILTSKLDVGDVLSTVMNLAGRLFQAQASSIRLLDTERGHLEVAAHAGLSAAYLQSGPLPLGASAAGLAAETRETVHVYDVASDARFQKADLAGREGLRSLLCLPLLIRERCIGVMTFYHRAPRTYTPDELQFLRAFASTVSIAVDNARLYEEQSRLAVTDGLTGLYNHRHFHEALAGEVGRARRYNHPVSLVLVDIDHFKRYNDTHGHQAGDALLRDLAALFRRAAREHDVVSRYGGEEFAFLLPQTGKREALTLAKRLCRTVARQRFDGADALPGARLTISLGVASYPEDVLHAPELVHRADQALYLAKNQGRNQAQAWQALH
jgi:diguanylate cyclase (GGDEF)-like protein